MLYEELQPDAADSCYVMRLEKEQNSITRTKEEFPARSYNISETWVRAMMAAIYCRFFKVPGTLEPPNETIDGDIVEAVPMILTPYLMERLIGNLNSVRENGI